jgi:hydroxymethylpyrimidine pyrophosphatase-like HAD family hydrolase
MIIAVDFDGTIVEHKYPAIGKEIPFAIDTLKKLQEEKHLLVLWTVREGDLLNEAVEFCKSKGLEFYAVNKDYPEETELSEDFSRKLKADLFIDDRNIGGIPDWGIIYRMINEGLTYEQIWAGDDMHQMMRNNKRKNIFLRIGEMIDRK